MKRKCIRVATSRGQYTHGSKCVKLGLFQLRSSPCNNPPRLSRYTTRVDNNAFGNIVISSLTSRQHAKTSPRLASRPSLAARPDNFLSAFLSPDKTALLFAKRAVSSCLYLTSRRCSADSYSFFHIHVTRFDVCYVFLKFNRVSGSTT